MKHVGVLTGGGDCPGLNAVIRGVVLHCAKCDMGVVGFRRGWQGLLDGGQTTLLSMDDVEEIHTLGGTILGTSRVDPFADPDGPNQVRANLDRRECVGLVVIGGEKTLESAYECYRQGLPIVGVPKTIDNNVGGTDYTFGFLTAINSVSEAIARLVTTAKSHGRVLVVQVMGHNSGWLALYAGMAGGAHQVLIPERPFHVDEICNRLKRRFSAGDGYSVILVSEGARPADPNEIEVPEQPSPEGIENGVAKILAQVIAQRTQLEVRHVVLGPLQRGGSPTAYDRVLGLRLGLKAAELVRGGQFGMMTSVRGTEIVAVPLEQALRKPKTVDDAFYQEVCEFFI